MGDFVTIDFESDPDAIADTAVEYLRAALPGWEPASASVEVHLIAALARIEAEVAEMAKSVPLAVFQQFGSELYGLPPLEGSAAAVASSWTAADTLGHTIPAGTQVAYRVTGDDLVVFEVDDDYVIPPGSSALSPVGLVATGVGVAWNGVPAGPLELVDALSWVSAVASTAVSAGGVDAETDTAYRDRLAAELRLSTPRPIVPDDFAVLARRVTGVYRCLALDGYDPGTNEVQRLTVTGAPTGGSTALTYSGQTATVPWNTTASGLQALLEGLSNIAPGDVACTGGPLPGTPIDVEFTGTLAVTDVATMTRVDSLTGGTTPAMTITTPTPGVAPSIGNARMVCVIPVDADGAACTPTIRTAVQTYLDGLREVTFVVTVDTPTSTTIDVTFAVKVASGYDPGTVVDACEAAVTAYLSPGMFSGGAESPPVWRFEDTVRYLAVSAVIAGVDGVLYVSSLTVNSGTVDVTMTGAAPLPAVGTVTGSAV